MKVTFDGGIRRIIKMNDEQKESLGDFEKLLFDVKEQTVLDILRSSREAAVARLKLLEQRMAGELSCIAHCDVEIAKRLKTTSNPFFSGLKPIDDVYKPREVYARRNAEDIHD